MESPFEKFVTYVLKGIGFIVIGAIVICSLIHVSGPEADAWFARHPVIHVFYRIVHIWEYLGCVIGA